jgi:hypothetical protein
LKKFAKEERARETQTRIKRRHHPSPTTACFITRSALNETIEFEYARKQFFRARSARHVHSKPIASSKNSALFSLFLANAR